jgi:hypothetical protein
MNVFTSRNRIEEISSIEWEGEAAVSLAISNSTHTSSPIASGKKEDR